MKNRLLQIAMVATTIVLFSCNNQKLEQYQLINENITIGFPKNYEQINTKEIESINYESAENIQYSVLVSSYYDLLRGDQTLDVLKDKKSDFHYLILLNTSSAPVFNEATFSKLKSAQEHQYSLITEADTSFKIELIDSKFEKSDSSSMVIIKHKFTISSVKKPFYKTVFFTNKSGKTVIAHELNELEGDSREYLKSMTVNP